MFMVLSEIDPTQTGLAVIVTGIVYALIDKIIVPLIKKDKSHDGSAISTECKGMWATQGVYNESIRRDLNAFRDDFIRRLDGVDGRVHQLAERNEGIRDKVSAVKSEIAVANTLIQQLNERLK